MTIIDAYNYIGRSKKFFLGQDRVEERLIKEICRYQQKKGGKFILVFDGQDNFFSPTQKLNQGQVQVKYTPKGKTADAEIMKLIEQELNKKKLLVVSSDKAVKSFAQKRDTQVISSEDFEKQINQDKFFNPKPKNISPHLSLSEKEIKEWLKFFSRPKKD